MKLGYRRWTLLVALVTFVSCLSSEGQKRAVLDLLIWNVSELESMRLDSTTNIRYVRNVLRMGEQHLEEGIVTVTTKKTTFAPSVHYYCSMGPYWWPDPEHPGKYINRDGYINPERSQYDREKLAKLTKRCQNLSRAFFLTSDSCYYDSFVRQLQAWFVNEETLMYPNFEYGQVIPGQNGNKGRSTGLIDAYDFNTIIESLRLVHRVKKIDNKTLKKLQQWFLTFADWAEDAYGEKFKGVNNNISLAFDVTMTNMYLFAGKERKAKEIVDDFARLRLDRQINEDGSQPSELKRTKAFSYSMFNLTHIVDMCYLARYWYPNYYEDHRERIDKAFEFLGQYVDSPETFPYQQITSWEKCKKEYQTQLSRINGLSGTE